jgi:hypothetical protein
MRGISVYVLYFGYYRFSSLTLSFLSILAVNTFVSTLPNVLCNCNVSRININPSSGILGSVLNANPVFGDISSEEVPPTYDVLMHSGCFYFGL